MPLCGITRIPIFRRCTTVATLLVGSFGVCLAGDRGTPSVAIANAASGTVLQIDVKGVGREPLNVAVTIVDFDGHELSLPMPRNPVPSPDGGAGRIAGPTIPKGYRGMMIIVEVTGAVTGADYDGDTRHIP